MSLSKRACGMPLQESLPRCVLINDWIVAIDHWLETSIRSGVEKGDVHQMYLQPLRWLLPDTSTNVLSVQAHIDGVLLSDWPWPLHIGSLPRLERPLDTRWSETPHVH